MGVSKIVLNNELLLDLTGDTVTPADVRAGVIFHGADGEIYEGTAEVSDAGELPEGYARLSCLRSDGTKYINTGYKPNSKTRVVISYAYLGRYSGGTGTAPLFGARIKKASSDFSFWALGAGAAYGADDYGTSVITTSDTPVVGAVNNLDKNKNVTVLNNVTYTHTVQSFTSNYEMFLFGINTAGSLDSQRALFEIYACKIYDDDVLVRDYVPAYCEADDDAGLYDKANAVFYPFTSDGSSGASEECATGTVSLSSNAVTMTIDAGVALSASDTFILCLDGTNGTSITQGYMCQITRINSSVKGFAISSSSVVDISDYEDSDAAVTYSGNKVNIDTVSWNFKSGAVYRWVVLKS